MDSFSRQNISFREAVLTAFQREYVEDIEGAVGDGLDALDITVLVKNVTIYPLNQQL